MSFMCFTLSLKTRLCILPQYSIELDKYCTVYHIWYLKRIQSFIIYTSGSQYFITMTLFLTNFNLKLYNDPMYNVIFLLIHFSHN